MPSDALTRLAAEMGRHGVTLQPPCRPTELERLRERARRELHAELPPEYVELLVRTDGLNWNGLFIYASATTPVVRSPHASIHGFVEMNLLYWDGNSFDDLLVFGEGNMDLYTRRMSSGEYLILDRVPGNVIETCRGFEQMLDQAVKAHL